ncbi:MAG TPA: polymer-forming cytoskeletal protein [Longimicrobiales bacterium]
MLARNQQIKVDGIFENGGGPLPGGGTRTLLSIGGDHAKIEGKFQIADSIEIQCEIGGELDVGGKLVIGERGIVIADVRTVDAIVMGSYHGNMIATGNVEITATGRVTGNIQTDSLIISKGGFFNGNVTKNNTSEPRRPVLVEDPDEVEERRNTDADEDAEVGARVLQHQS